MYTKPADTVFGLFATLGGVCLDLFTQEIINFCPVPLNVMLKRGLSCRA